MDEQPVKQAFGSPGGKSYLAPRIVDMIPPHRTYVEPFAGGAAVFFRKARSEKEVLNDKDSEIAFAFRFLRDMTPEQYERLKKREWTHRESIFRKLRQSNPTDDGGRFYKFYYLKKASFISGSSSYNHHQDGTVTGVDHLWKVRDRLRRSAIHNTDAAGLIRRYDSPRTFFYLDPPYPQRAFVGAKEDYTSEDLAVLLGRVKGMKGKAMISLGTEHTRLLPRQLCVRRVKVARNMQRRGMWNPGYQFEIVATNYNPDKVLRMRRRDGYRRRSAAPSGLAGMKG